MRWWWCREGGSASRPVWHRFQSPSPSGVLLTTRAQNGQLWDLLSHFFVVTGAQRELRLRLHSQHIAGRAAVWTFLCGEQVKTHKSD